MTLVHRIRQAALGAGVGLLALGYAMPAHAQEQANQQESQTGITEPTPLIVVRPGPAVPPEAPGSFLDYPLPDTYSLPVGPFTMDMDVIATGPSAYGLFTAPGCVVDSVFKRGMKLVWRFEVYDMAAGTRLTDRDGTQVMVGLPDGSTIAARVEPRAPGGEIAPDAPWTWVAVWNIPPDYPLGPVDYSVLVSTPDGRSGELRPSNWGGNRLQIVQ
jgi:hypothetical protein